MHKIKEACGRRVEDEWFTREEGGNFLAYVADFESNGQLIYAITMPPHSLWSLAAHIHGKGSF